MGGRPFQVVERGDAYTENEGCRDDFHENSLRVRAEVNSAVCGLR